MWKHQPASDASKVFFFKGQSLCFCGKFGVACPSNMGGWEGGGRASLRAPPPPPPSPTPLETRSCRLCIKAAPELRAGRSRVNVHGDNGEDHVLVPPANDYAQVALLLDSSADVGRRGNPLAVDGDNDVVLLEATARRRKRRETDVRTRVRVPTEWKIRNS